MFAMLGPIQFRLITYFEGVETRQPYDYAVHDVVDGKPRLQSMGDGLKGVKIDILFHSAYCNPELEMVRLTAAASSHEAMSLVYGSGKYEGQFVIEQIRSSTRHTDRKGGLVAITAQLQLMEWAGGGFSILGMIIGAVATLARASTAAATSRSPGPSPSPGNNPGATSSSSIVRN